MISRRSRNPLFRGVRSARLNCADRLREGGDRHVEDGSSEFVKRACEMTDAEMLKLVNAVQGTGLAVARHKINFHRMDEPAQVRSVTEWVVNYQPRSRARQHPDAPIDE